MFTTEQYLNAMRKEVAVLKHLYTKVPKDKLDYRPTPSQRSLRELLNYMPMNITLIRLHINGEWSTVQQIRKEVEEAAAKDFCGTLDRELTAFVKYVSAIPESDFATKDVRLPPGGTAKLGDHLMNFPLQFLAAYKMQLFLYLKSCGMTELNTFNCWLGMDRKMPS